jgi:hypothetical protein
MFLNPHIPWYRKSNPVSPEAEKSCRFEESSNPKLAIQNQRLKPGRDPVRWTKRQCLTPFKQTLDFLYGESTATHRSARRIGAGGG